MTATLTTPAEQRVILKNISWQMFESLLTAKGEDSATRFAYDRGWLEIMSPLMAHEHIKRLLEDCVKILVDELKPECEKCWFNDLQAGRLGAWT